MQQLLFPAASDLMKSDENDIRTEVYRLAPTIRESLLARKAELRGSEIYIELSPKTDPDVIAGLCAELARAGYEAWKRNDGGENDQAIGVKIKREE